MSLKLLVIIPTYNESKNIARLISLIESLNVQGLDILVIDDNSPDKTAEVVNRLKASYNNLSLLTRDKKLGLGSAYIAGFRWAIKNNYEAVVEMDADFSHNPQYLIKIINSLKTHDFVIGSRYVRQGGVKNWTFLRRLISRAGNIYAKIILGVGVCDLTGGFNAWKIDVFKKINLDEIKSNGYSFQIEIKYRSIKNGFTFIELPIVFYEREEGKSKMSKSIFFEAIWRVWSLRYHKTISSKKGKKNF